MDAKHITVALLLATLGCAHAEPTTVDPASTIQARDQALVSDVPGAPALTPEQAREKQAIASDERQASDEPPVQDATLVEQGSKADCERAVFFRSGSAALSPEARRQLSRVAACLKRHDVDHALVVGAADVRGSAKQNERLALDRAEAVAEFLRGLGVDEQDIRVRARDEMASAEARQLWPLEKQATVSVPVKNEERARTAE